MDDPELTPQLMLQAYAAGIFPMSESRDDPQVFWVDPNKRGVIPLDGFHISKSLRKQILTSPYEPRFNTDFSGVVAGCADREETWINDTIFAVYAALHTLKHAHSQEVYLNDQLVGGVYGVTIGSAFFGESMFSRAPSASKLALAYLVDRLRQTGFTLFDTQFLTPHLASMGGREIERASYLRLLGNALRTDADITQLGSAQRRYDVIQRNTQIS